MFASSVEGGAAVREFGGVSLGDRRLDARLRSLVQDLSRAPAKSLPGLLPSSAKREAAYRFFANSAVAAEAVLAPHANETRGRMRTAASGMVRIVHDTTRFVFKGDREDLGTLMKGARGFLGHFALAVDGSELRDPLGVVGLHTWVNDDEALKARRKMTRAEVLAHWLHTPREKKAMHRWESLAVEVHQALPPDVRGIHVMDQEADDFHVFFALTSRQVPFVIRGEGNRLTEDGPRLAEVLATHEDFAFRDVQVNRRPQAMRGRTFRPARSERTARLRVRFAPVSIRRPSTLKAPFPNSLALNVVHVFEPNPPEGEEPVEWVLLTSETVTTFEEALGIVDHYRARWLIEEFFKALKTGCSVEKRQLTNYDGLRRLLAVFVPIAWQLLRMRYLSRQAEPPGAEAVMQKAELRLLRGLLLEHDCDYELPAHPTARDALFAIAALGGHIPSNGDPGWLVLGRGYEEYLAAQRGWNAALGEM